MKNTASLVTAIVAVFLCTGFSTPTPSYALDLEEDMTEDLILSTDTPKEEVEYQYDSSNDTASELIAEEHIVDECEPATSNFEGDHTDPAPENFMAEGIFFEDSEKNMSDVLNKYGSPAAGEKGE